MQIYETILDLLITLRPVWGWAICIFILILLLFILVHKRKTSAQRTQEIPFEPSVATEKPDTDDPTDADETLDDTMQVISRPATDHTGLSTPEAKLTAAQDTLSGEAAGAIGPDTDSTTDPAVIGLIDRLKKGLSKTRQILSTDIDKIFSGEREIDSDLLEELEELLITSDIGVRTSVNLIDKISKRPASQSGPDQIKELLKKEFLSILAFDKPVHTEMSGKPAIIMIVGVNGVGKTTTIGKLAAQYTTAGKKVLIAAADTFRAAAGEQLAIWAERAGADLVKSKPKADPAAVAYDSIEAALARDIDIVLIDTAGRLHTKVNLMEELIKIKRTIAKKLPLEPREMLLVLDATTGQNAIHQAELFNEALGVTGIAMTKLDGTAKGGIVIPICNELKIPLKYIGIGEKIADLQEFKPKAFIEALL